MVQQSVLVTGGNGFIGKRLVSRLLSERWKVTCVGRTNPQIEGADYLELDQFSDERLTAVLKDKSFDAVFHLAAYGVAPSQQNADLAYTVNVTGTAAIVKAAKQVGARVVVYAGSCAEYRPVETGLLIPEDTPFTVASSYGASKAAGGVWGQSYAQQLGINFVWLRFFGVYGPGEAPHRLLPAIASALSKGDRTQLSAGTQIRDFLFVEDAVTALLLGQTLGSKNKLGPFNVCSGVAVSVRDFALAVAAAMKKPSELLGFGDLPLRTNENMWLVGRPTTFYDACGFVPQVPLETGIARTLNLDPSNVIES